MRCWTGWAFPRPHSDEKRPVRLRNQRFSATAQPDAVPLKVNFR